MFKHYKYYEIIDKNRLLREEGGKDKVYEYRCGKWVHIPVAEWDKEKVAWITQTGAKRMIRALKQEYKASRK